ncbi:aminopeptidase P family protein [Limisphaera ngatamarikiensis]|uniref:aminopeptidase P family protein n=1 Tax=Limisphaera ngatamarikiensis TaxID=1324935 RepID=UPI00197CF275|nr:aminopeptidase P family protein [Limisphaera ngatamarikiensis]
MIKPVTIPARLFRENRDRLRQLLPPRSLVVLNANDVMPANADGTLGFIQNADLFYLTGILQEQTILVLAPDASDPAHREILFLRRPDEQTLIWEGPKLSREEARKISGIEQVRWLDEFPVVFRQLMCEMELVYLNSNEHYRAMPEVETRDARFIRECQRQYPLHQYRRLAPLMHQLRTVKSPIEVDLIHHACQLTGRAFRKVLRRIRPGINEAEVEAEFAREFIRQRARFAYPPIIASGPNSCVLHYTRNDRTCRSGEVLLLDVAASYGSYNADMTRTVPVNGRFSRRQRQVYDAVLRVFRQMTRALLPGKTLADLRKEAEALIAEECRSLGLLPKRSRQTGGDSPPVRRYFMHGVSHPIGLDVHDVLHPGQPIAAGWVLTCEPAIYIREEGLGIRLENTFLITDQGPVDLMGDIPIEPDEIEELMRR